MAIFPAPQNNFGIPKIILNFAVPKYMVSVVQLVEHRIVVPSVVGSSPITHPCCNSRRNPRVAFLYGGCKHRQVFDSTEPERPIPMQKVGFYSTNLLHTMSSPMPSEPVFMQKVGYY